MKKIAVVYYSMSGNTEYVAKHISDDRKNEADIIRDVIKIKGDKFTESQLKIYYSQLKSASYINY